MTARAILLVMMSVGWWRLAAAGNNQRLSAGTMVRAGAVVAGLVGVLAMASGPLLDALEVDTETFRIATGLAVLALGLARVLGWGLAAEGPAEMASGWLWPVAYPVLIGPELVLVAISVGSDHGVLVTLLAAMFAAVLAILVSQLIGVSDRPKRVWPTAVSAIGVRGAGVVLVVLAVALVFDGLRDV